MGVSKENELWVDFEEAILASKTPFWAVFFNFSYVLRRWSGMHIGSVWLKLGAT